MSNNGVGVVLYDAESDEEIEGVDFPYIQVVPAVGSIVHYWQDGTAERATGVPVRRDFLVD